MARILLEKNMETFFSRTLHYLKFGGRSKLHQNHYFHSPLKNAKTEHFCCTKMKTEKKHALLKRWGEGNFF